MPNCALRRFVAVVAFMFANLLALRGANAEEEPQTPPTVSLMSFVGYGGSSSHANLPNIYALGVGIRAGGTFSNGIYAGALLTEHSGYSLAPAVPDSQTATAPVRGSRTVLGGEVGHDWQYSLIYRLYFGAGVYVDHGVDIDQKGKLVPIFSDPSFVMWPGGMVLFPIHELVLGADVRLTIPGASEAAVGYEAFAVVGMRLKL